MEVTYGAALHLMMANSLFPDATDKHSYSEEAHGILDEMIFKGNRLAAARKTELAHLEGLFGELTLRVERYGLQTLSLTTPEHLQNEIESVVPHIQAFPSVDPNSDFHSSDISGCLDPSLSLAHPGGGVELLDDMGISSYEFLSIIEQIGGTDSSALDFRPS